MLHNKYIPKKEGKEVVKNLTEILADMILIIRLALYGMGRGVGVETTVISDLLCP